MDLREVFATNLRRIRHAKGLSQDELAYEAAISRSYLSQTEKGAFFASLRIVGKLAAALNVEPAELLKSTRSEGSGANRAQRLRNAGR
jgi:transcriptional regulator with XRE-family HTH domain